MARYVEVFEEKKKKTNFWNMSTAIELWLHNLKITIEIFVKRTFTKM